MLSHNQMRKIEGNEASWRIGDFGSVCDAGLGDYEVREYIQKLVKENPGKYSELGLITAVRSYGNINVGQDPGVLVAREFIDGMISRGDLDGVVD